MIIEIAKLAEHDDIHITRDDGSTAETTFPKKGLFPHDAVHVVVEEALDLNNAFWGMIAQGKHPEDIQALAKEAGHASAKRACEPDPSIIELLQAERIVECFEAELWSAPSDLGTLQGVIDAACASSFVATVSLDEKTAAEIRTRLSRLNQEWLPAPLGKTMTFVWPEN
ncbi:hypothetical protein [Hyphococcus luteus]|uniref:Uncharacterized protein n=1 Tax=Hyphococcus luteus TaxID=2058213 RepID=A0A2S7K3G5_9PROT|nr:hypothetical protein [Marinicaulis flavus]PQA87039.1 hypothetical protein CW354_13390 [Marinicaulis flavus]